MVPGVSVHDAVDAGRVVVFIAAAIWAVVAIRKAVRECIL